MRIPAQLPTPGRLHPIVRSATAEPPPQDGFTPSDRNLWNHVIRPGLLGAGTGAQVAGLLKPGLSYALAGVAVGAAVGIALVAVLRELRS